MFYEISTTYGNLEVSLFVAGKIEDVSPRSRMGDLHESFGDIDVIRDSMILLASSPPTLSYKWAVAELKELRRYLVYLDAYIEYNDFEGRPPLLSRAQKIYQEYVDTLDAALQVAEPFVAVVGRAQTEQQRCKLTYEVVDVAEAFLSLEKASGELLVGVSGGAADQEIENDRYGVATDLEYCQQIASLAFSVVNSAGKAVDCIKRNELPTNKDIMEMHAVSKRALEIDTILYSRIERSCDEEGVTMHNRLEVIPFLLDVSRTMMAESDPMKRAQLFYDIYLQLNNCYVSDLTDLCMLVGHDRDAQDYYITRFDSQKNAIAEAVTNLYKRCGSAQEFLGEVKVLIKDSMVEIKRLAKEAGSIDAMKREGLSCDQQVRKEQLHVVLALLDGTGLLHDLVVNPERVVALGSGSNLDDAAGGGGGAGQ